jgi:hypothetical protein
MVAWVGKRAALEQQSTGSLKVDLWPSRAGRCLLSGIAGPPALLLLLPPPPQAQKIRTRMAAHFRRVFEGGCHFIITPTVPCVAPLIPEAALRGGAAAWHAQHGQHGPGQPL